MASARERESANKAPTAHKQIIIWNSLYYYEIIEGVR